MQVMSENVKVTLSIISVIAVVISFFTAFVWWAHLDNVKRKAHWDEIYEQSLKPVAPFKCVNNVTVPDEKLTGKITGLAAADNVVCGNDERRNVFCWRPKECK